MALVAIVKPTPKSAAKMLSAGAVGLIKWAMEATLIPQQGAVVSVQAVDRLPAVNCDIVASKMCDMQRGVVDSGDVTDARLRREAQRKRQPPAALARQAKASPAKRS